MECLKFIVDTMYSNLQEARKYVGMIAYYRGKNKAVADWCKDMASSHVAFNSAGTTTAKKLIEEIRTSNSDNHDYTEGMLVVWGDRLIDISAQNVELKAMVDSYK